VGEKSLGYFGYFMDAAAAAAAVRTRQTAATDAAKKRANSRRPTHSLTHRPTPAGQTQRSTTDEAPTNDLSYTWPGALARHPVTRFTKDGGYRRLAGGAVVVKDRQTDSVASYNAGSFTS